MEDRDNIAPEETEEGAPAADDDVEAHSFPPPGERDAYPPPSELGAYPPPEREAYPPPQ